MKNQHTHNQTGRGGVGEGGISEISQYFNDAWKKTSYISRMQKSKFLNSWATLKIYDTHFMWLLEVYDNTVMQTTAYGRSL